MRISFLTWAGMLLTLAAIVLTGAAAKKRVRSASDFIRGGSMGTALIAGSLVGTMVGGASTIGTAQLAFTYGFSAWWFTLGGGIGLAVMGLCFVKPLRRSDSVTIAQIMEKAYGRSVATVAAILMSLGTFISIVSQLLSGSALLASVSPLGPVLSALAVVALMMVYVIFGGAMGAGMVGIVKTVLLYGSTLVCGLVALSLSGGVSALYGALPHAQYFSLFARGVWKDGGAGASLLFGVLTTQAYLLPIVSGKSAEASKRGALLAGALTTVIGVAGIAVGLYMRVAMPDIPAASAMPVFVCSRLPDWLGGIVLATLLIALVGTGAGLALGMSALLTCDIYKARIDPNASDRRLLAVSRGLIALIFASAAVLCVSEAGSMILSWSFLSMGLRGAVAFVPLCAALFLPGRLPGSYAMACVIAGPTLVLAGSFLLPEGIDPLFLGMLGALLIGLLGLVRGARR